MDMVVQKMSLQDESYLCLLCLRNSTERIAGLYFTYIQLRQSLSYGVPGILCTALLILKEKQNNLDNKLLSYWPDYMKQGKWHEQETQISQLGDLSQESREDLQRICVTEMRLLMLITEMMNQQ